VSRDARKLKGSLSRPDPTHSRPRKTLKLGGYRQRAGLPAADRSPRRICKQELTGSGRAGSIQ